MKRLLLFALLFTLSCLTPASILAHEGPPFPIVSDEKAGPYLVSVWTDPDIGTGIFFVILEPVHKGEMTLPESVRISVVPTSGRLPEATYEVHPQDVRYGARYYAEVPFDVQDFWDVRVTIDGVEKYVITSKVESTPDGTIGPIGLAVYLFPFLAVGFLWLKAMRRRKKLQAAG